MILIQYCKNSMCVTNIAKINESVELLYFKSEFSITCVTELYT